MDKLRVKRADDCIWLIDDRGKHQEIHLTPRQAKEYGQKLVDIATEPQENPNDYISPKMPDEDKPCYLCKHCGDDPNFVGDEYCKFLKISVNDWGTCKHYKERGD